MLVSPLQRPSSLVESVCAQLAQVIRGETSEGHNWLPPERKLAEQLGVSRTVVREATKRLELQGMLEVQHGIGIKVVDRLHSPLNAAVALLLPDEEDRLRQLTETRLVLEPSLARLAAAKMNAESSQRLRVSLQQLSNAKTHDEAIPADMNFHRAIADISGNAILHLLMQSMADLHRSSLARGYQRVSTANAIKHHGEILDALEAHDGERAASLMHAHLVAAWYDLGLSGTPAGLEHH